MTDYMEKVTRAPKPTGEVIKDTGDDVDKFLHAETTSTAKLTQEEFTMYMKNKKMGRIRVEIVCESGKIPFTKLVDEYNLQLDTGKTADNVKVMRDKLENIRNQIEVLVKLWTTEMGK